jgi:hypothetical protein
LGGRVGGEALCLHPLFTPICVPSSGVSRIEDSQPFEWMRGGRTILTLPSATRRQSTGPSREHRVDMAAVAQLE